MRKILFMGKTHNGLWAKGIPEYSGNSAFINDGLKKVEIDPKTLSEFTGLYDSHHKQIFEGHKVKAVTYKGYEIGYIEFINGSFCFCTKNTKTPVSKYDGFTIIWHRYDVKDDII